MPSLMREAGRLLDQVKKFRVALDKLQNEHCTIADACHVWYELMKDPDLSQYKEAIYMCFKEAMVLLTFWPTSLSNVHGSPFMDLIQTFWGWRYFFT